MTDVLWLDTETYNVVDIAAGTYRYAETAEVMLITWAINDDPVQLWDHNDGTPPPDFEALVHARPGLVVRAHNAMFDRNVLRLGNLQQDIPIERWQCVMVQAFQHALPGALDELGRVLGLPQEQQKLAEGKKLLNKFCKPTPSNHKVRRYTKHTHPDEWERFRQYAIQDVQAMRECWRRLPDWNWDAEDIALYHLDQRINDRGFCADLELAMAGSAASEREKTTLRKRFAELTDGLRPSQRGQVQAFINGRWGLGLTSTAKHIMQPIADGDAHPPDLREIARIVLAANKTSTAKYESIAEAVSMDGRFRGGLQMSGAKRTRRFAGRKFQPQNLPSRGLPKAEAIEAYTRALKDQDDEALGAVGDPMLYGAAALRGIVQAPPGKKLVVSDLSNIEGRVLAFLAGEDWKLDAFRAYDTLMRRPDGSVFLDEKGKPLRAGPDVYNLTAVDIIGGDPHTVSGENRNVFGKVPDLALGFEGGAGALQTFAKGYGVRMTDYWDLIQSNISAEHVQRAYDNFEKWGHMKLPELGIDKVEWLASETVKLAWRGRHPATRRLWYATKDAAIAALRNPGRIFRAGKHLQFLYTTHAGFPWLLVRLPSGKFLTYFEPYVSADNVLSYSGEATEDGKTTARVWTRVYTYGGKLIENATQALAGDVLKYNFPAVEQAGYEIVLTVHDEDVTETPDTPDYNAEALSRIIATVPPWAEGMPLDAAGFEAQRYKKD